MFSRTTAALASAITLAAACAQTHPGPTDVADVAEVAPVDAAVADQDAAEPGAEVEPTAPPDLLLTINELPPHLNGTFPLPNGNPYSIWTNRSNFTLDLMSKAPKEIDWSTLSVSCTHALTMPDGSPTASGDELAPFFELHPSVDAVPRRVHFTQDVGVEEGLQVVCQASVGNRLGEASSTTSFVVATLEPGLDPFVTPDLWLVTLTRDIFDTTFTNNGDGTYTVASSHVPSGNGELDFDEAFVGLGFFSETNVAVRAEVKRRILAAVRSHAHRIFQLDDDGAPTAEGVPLRLAFEGDPGAPASTSWSEGGELSMIALGGDGTPKDQQSGIVGRADVDWNNQGVEDNTVYDRGVYPTGIARSVLAQPIGVLALADLLPQVGTPLGDHPGDDALFAADFDPSTVSGDARHRYDLAQFAIEMVAIAIASTLCHEIGHSLGLVPPGAPPNGLFSGMPKLDFIDNYIDDGHIDTAGLNVMQTGKVTNYIEAVSQVPAFNSLNMAYLRRRVVVLPQP